MGQREEWGQGREPSGGRGGDPVGAGGTQWGQGGGDPVGTGEQVGTEVGAGYDILSSVALMRYWVSNYVHQQ